VNEKKTVKSIKGKLMRHATHKLTNNNSRSSSERGKNKEKYSSKVIK
jgi:hypothetical protein